VTGRQPHPYTTHGLRKKTVRDILILIALHTVRVRVGNYGHGWVGVAPYSACREDCITWRVRSRKHFATSAVLAA